jgi:DHA1 family multidrug resistance protein-like MFS transporter
MALFVLFSLGAALVNNIGGLLILRFLQGFWGSPALATVCFPIYNRLFTD